VNIEGIFFHWSFQTRTASILNRDTSCVTQKVLFRVPSLCRVRGYILGENTVYLEPIICNEVEPLCLFVPRIFHPSRIRFKFLYNLQHVTDRVHSLLLWKFSPTASAVNYHQGLFSLSISYQYAHCNALSGTNCTCAWCSRGMPEVSSSLVLYYRIRWCSSVHDLFLVAEKTVRCCHLSLSSRVIRYD
jgi:hypothetical protein